MEHVLELKNVSKKLGGKKVIDNLSFTVEAGEVFGFLGPNGAGKTTTIKMIVGLLSVDQGEIYIDGINIKKHFEKAMRNVGAIIENPEMYTYLSGMTNLKMYGRMHGKISKERYAEIVEQVKLTKRIKDKVKKYSLGMKQRLGVAQALVHKPKLLILDEPTNGLDPAGIKELRDNLRTMAREEGLAVLVSSHLLSEMELMCDRFGIIDDGVLTETKRISSVDEMDENQRFSYMLEVDNKEKAIEIVRGFFRTESTEEESQMYDLSNLAMTKEESADIVNALISGGVKLYGITQKKRSLEEEFIEATNKKESQIS